MSQGRTDTHQMISLEGDRNKTEERRSNHAGAANAVRKKHEFGKTVSRCRCDTGTTCSCVSVRFDDKCIPNTETFSL